MIPEVAARGSDIVLATRRKDELVIRNDTDRPLFFVVEDRNWTMDALTGERVIAMPAFRRLCPEQLLRPGDDVAIGRVAIMFTDLQGSTKLYEDLGDATAYRLVRDHFAFLSERVQHYDGFIVKTVGDGLTHQRVIRDLALAGQVFRTGDLIGKDGSDQIFGAHARELRRHFFAAAEPRQRKRHAYHPAPARNEHRRIEQRLDQERPDRRGVEIARDLGKLEAMCGGQREDNIVLGRRRLQLEIEFAAKALAQRQSPGAVDAAAVGRMDDELHAADLVEEALEHDRVLRRQAAQRRMGRGKIFEQLLGRALGDPDFVDEPAQYSLGWFAAAQARGDFRPQA